MQKYPIYISVLVPVYNVPELFLRRCLDSLIAQTMEHAEFILVDDGSTNNSGQICDEYAKKDIRIIVTHKKNGGLSAARNTAFSIASGTYIMFLDGDDYLEPETCEQAFNVVKQKDVDIVFWNIQTEYPHSSIVTRPFRDQSRFLTTKEVNKLQNNVLDFNAKLGQVFAKLIKREILTKNKIFHEESLQQGAEGIVFNFELFANVNSAYYLNKTLNHYVYNAQSISHSPDINNYYLILKCFSFIQNIIVKDSIQNREELLELVDVRLLYVIITTAISGFFNPLNKKSYQEKIKGFKTFLKEKVVQHALVYGDRRGLSKQRKIILWLIEHKWFIPIELLAWARKLQYKNR